MKLVCMLFDFDFYLSFTDLLTITVLPALLEMKAFDFTFGSSFGFGFDFGFDFNFYFDFSFGF